MTVIYKRGRDIVFEDYDTVVLAGMCEYSGDMCKGIRVIGTNCCDDNKVLCTLSRPEAECLITDMATHSGAVRLFKFM